jgi:hypothetical protein
VSEQDNEENMRRRLAFQERYVQMAADLEDIGYTPAQLIELIIWHQSVMDRIQSACADELELGDHSENEVGSILRRVHDTLQIAREEPFSLEAVQQAWNFWWGIGNYGPTSMARG